MGSTDPLTGARYPTSGDAVTLWTYFQNLANDLSGLIGGNYGSSSARDTAYNAWVAQGHTMTNGLQCRVNGFPQTYRSGAWHGTTPFPLTANPYTGSSIASSSGSVALQTIAIADPGYPYQVSISSTMAVLVSSGSLWSYEARIDTVGGTLVRPLREVAETAYTRIYLVGGMTGVLTGAHSILFCARFESGPGGSGFQVWNTTSDTTAGTTGENSQAFQVTVIPS